MVPVMSAYTMLLAFIVWAGFWSPATEQFRLNVLSATLAAHTLMTFAGLLWSWRMDHAKLDMKGLGLDAEMEADLTPSPQKETPSK